MIDSVEDINIFFSDFAVEATYDMATIRVIFDKHFRISLAGVETSTPAATVKTSEVLDFGMKHKDQITINDTLYQITGIQHDGAGMTVLLLENIE